MSSIARVGRDTATLGRNAPAASASQPSPEPTNQTATPRGVRYEPDLAAGYLANAAEHEKMYADFERLFSER